MQQSVHCQMMIFYYLPSRPFMFQVPNKVTSGIIINIHCHTALALTRVVFYHSSGKHAREKSTPPHGPPLLYSKTGVCRGIHIFSYFPPKHRLWVLVRTASPSKSKKKIQNFLLKIFNFYNLKNLCIYYMGMFSYWITKQALFS